MAEYLLIESRDPFESNNVEYYYDLARGLAEAGSKVALFLVQNAVFAARPSAHAPKLRSLVSSGINVLADDFSLTARFESYGAGNRLRLGWARRWSMRRIAARVTIASETSGSAS